MDTNKQPYYVNMTTEEVIPEPIDSPSFRVFATPQEHAILERVLQKNQEKDFETYISAHIPNFIVDEPRDDPSNKGYDKTMRRIYGVIHALGDEEAKRHIEGMGILSHKTFKDPTTTQEEVQHSSNRQRTQHL